LGPEECFWKNLNGEGKKKEGVCWDVNQHVLLKAHLSAKGALFRVQFPQPAKVDCEGGISNDWCWVSVVAKEAFIKSIIEVKTEGNNFDAKRVLMPQITEKKVTGEKKGNRVLKEWERKGTGCHVVGSRNKVWAREKNGRRESEHSKKTGRA